MKDNELYGRNLQEIDMVVKKTVIIIVLYHPSDEKIRRISSSLNYELILVDNTPESDLKIFEDGVYYIPLKRNTGIAVAQNIGIEKAFKIGASYVIFFDQDSEMENNFISCMYQEYLKIESASDSIPILGPIVINERSGHQYKMEKGKMKNGFTQVKSLISSGSIMNIEIFKKVGMMDSSLFIDYVDFEFCWRATSKGYYSYITDKVQLLHSVGQSINTFFGIPIIESTSIRYYYQYRNFFWLCRRSYVPFTWKVRVMIRKCFELVYMSIISVHRLQILKHIFMGIKDGMFKSNNTNEKSINIRKG